MCPEFERVERVVAKDVWGPEQDPESDGSLPVEGRMVKKFRRAAAGVDEQLPSDLRPPAVLKKTVDFLFDDVVGGAETLGSVHHFVWDRTRAIRNDFSIQQITKPEDVRIAVECYERIARFHILSLHQLAVPEKPYDKYDWYQEREQLDRTLLSLMQYYEDNRGRMEFENEAEFRAYCVIFQIQDPTPDLEDRVNSWDYKVRTDRRVRKALEIYAAACNTSDIQGPLKPRAAHPIAQEDGHAFFALVESFEVSYLMSCVAEVYFRLVRRTILKNIWMSFRSTTVTRQDKRQPELADFTIGVMTEILGFDDEEQTEEFCQHNGFVFKESDITGQLFLDLYSVQGRAFPEPSPELSNQVFSYRIVEAKRMGRIFPAVISGLNVVDAQDNELIEEAYGEEADEQMGEGEEEESLFVHQEPAKSSNTTLFAPKVPDATKQTTPGSSSFFGSANAGDNNTSAFAKPANPFANISSQANAQSQSSQPTPNSFQSPFSKPDSTAPSSSPFALKPAQANGFGSSPFSSFGKPSTAETAEPAPPAPGASPFAKPATSLFAPPAPSKSPFAQPSSSPAPADKPSLFSTQPAPSNQSSAFGTSPFAQQPAKQQGQAPSTASNPFQNLNGTSTTSNMAESKPKEVPSNPFASSLSNFSSSAANAPAQEPAAPKAPMFSWSPQQPAESAPSTVPEATTPQKPKFDIMSAGSTTPAGPPPKVPSFSFPNPTPSAFGAPPSQPAASKASPAPANPPKKPSPLSRSYSAEEEEAQQRQLPDFSQHGQLSQKSSSLSLDKQPSNAPATTAQSFAAPQKAAPAPPQPKPDVLQKLAEEMILDLRKGLVKQFVEHFAKETIGSVYEELHQEQSNQLADDFRRETLMFRYGKRWKQVCRHLRLARQGKEKRRRAKRDLEQKEMKKKEAVKVDAVEEFLRSTHNADLRKTARRQRMESESVNGDHPEFPEVQRRSPSKIDSILFASMGGAKRPASRPASAHGPDPVASASSTHKRVKSTASQVDGDGRVTKPAPPKSDVSTTSNRSHFLGFSLQRSRAGPALSKSTTSSNYFRLKAMGVDPTGGALAASSAKKRSREESAPDSRESTVEPPPSKRRTPPRSGRALAPARARSQSIQSQSSAITFASDALAPKAMSKAQEEDELLFARARAAREALADSAQWYRAELQKQEREPQLDRSQGSLGRSQGSNSSTDSPSLARARMEARLRASQGPDMLRSISGHGTAAKLPAYRLRESRFVPKEQYGRAVQRARELIEARSRAETESRMETERVSTREQSQGVVSEKGAREYGNFGSADPFQEPPPPTATDQSMETALESPAGQAVVASPSPVEARTEDFQNQVEMRDATPMQEAAPSTDVEIQERPTAPEDSVSPVVVDTHERPQISQVSPPGAIETQETSQTLGQSQAQDFTASSEQAAHPVFQQSLQQPKQDPAPSAAPHFRPQSSWFSQPKPQAPSVGFSFAPVSGHSSFGAPRQTATSPFASFANAQKETAQADASATDTVRSSTVLETQTLRGGPQEVFRGRTRSVSQAASQSAASQVVSLLSEDENEEEEEDGEEDGVADSDEDLLSQPEQEQDTEQSHVPDTFAEGAEQASSEEQRNLSELASNGMDQFKQLFDYQQASSSWHQQEEQMFVEQDVSYPDLPNGMHVDEQDGDDLPKHGDQAVRYPGLTTADEESEEDVDQMIDPALTNGAPKEADNVAPEKTVDEAVDGEEGSEPEDEEEDGFSGSEADNEGYGDEEQGYASDEQSGFAQRPYDSEEEGMEDFDEEDEEGYSEEESEDDLDGNNFQRPAMQSKPQDTDLIKAGTGTQEDAFELSD